MLLARIEKRNPKKLIKIKPVTVLPVTNGIILFKIEFSNTSTNLLHFYYLQHVLLESIK